MDRQACPPSVCLSTPTKTGRATGSYVFGDSANEGAYLLFSSRFRYSYPSWGSIHIFTIGVAIVLKAKLLFRNCDDK